MTNGPIENHVRRVAKPSGVYDVPELPHERFARDDEVPPVGFGPDCEPPPANDAETPGPTPTDPLRGLESLARVAILGAARILELATAVVVYAWQDIVTAGIIVVIAGGPGEGKTTLLFLILVARCSSEPFALLGRRMDPAPADKWIVLIEAEHSEGSAARKLVRSCEVLRLDTNVLDRVIVVARKAVRLGSPEWFDVVKLMAAGLVSDVAIDTLARVAPSDANGEAEQIAIFDIVAQAIEAAPNDEPKPIVWCVAHTRKNAQTADLADVSGSTQRTGQADTVLLVKGDRVDGQTVASTVTFAKIREEPDDYPKPVTFSIARAADGTRSLVTRDAAFDAVADDRPLETRILERLALGPHTKTKLSEKLGRSDKDIDGAITNLFAAHAITTTFVKVRGVDRKAFALRENLTRLSPDEAVSP